MPTFTGSGIEPEIQGRILDFLNSAQTAVHIAGSEPQAGPVHDDPAKGYGDQIRDYDFGLATTRYALARHLEPEEHRS